MFLVLARLSFSAAREMTHPIKEMFIACPTCNKQHDYYQSKPWSPFCSERCKQIDLGAWANEEHRIKGEPTQLSPSSQKQEDKSREATPGFDIDGSD